MRTYRYIHWIESDCFDGNSYVFRFRLGTLSPIITIRLWENERGRWSSSCTHGIKTPLQPVPYWSFRMPDKKEYILWQAVTALTDFYGPAITAGHVPSDDWLHPYFDVLQAEQ